jgi:hypothetical protein
MSLAHTAVGTWPYSVMKRILFMGAKNSLACEYGRLRISPVVVMSRKCAKLILSLTLIRCLSAALEHTGSRNTAVRVSPTRRRQCCIRRPAATFVNSP